jgi:lysophospholipase L1-like esterase
VLLVGSNDLVKDGADPIMVGDEIAAVAETLVTAERQVILTTLPPTRDDHEGANEAIRELNDRLARPVGPGVRVVDLHSALVDDDGQLSEQYSQDGLHLTNAAYLRWTDCLEETLATRLR